MIIAASDYTISIIYDGEDGQGVSSILTQYKISSSNTNPDAGRSDGSIATWVDVRPSDIETDEYIWYRYVYTYDDGTTSNSNAIYDSTIDGISSILDTENRTIKDSVWETAYFTVVDPDTGETIQMNIKNTIVESVTDITGIEQRVSTTETNLGDFTNSEYTLFKQSVNQFQTEVTNNLNNTTTIATQTAEDFSWMFSKGVYDAYLVDEDGNYVIDEDGNFIKAEKESPDGSARIAFTREGINVVNGIISIKAPNGETTIIEGGKINTNCIVSLDGTSWINLGLGTFDYGNKLTWNGATLSVDGEIYARSGNIASGVTIGDVNGYHAVMDADSFDVFGSDGQTRTATFGAETIIGNLSTRGVRVSDDGFLFRANSNDAFTVGIDSRTGSTDETRNATTYDSTRTIDGITYYRIAQIPTGESVLSAGYGTPPWELEPDSMIIGASGYVQFYIDDDRYLWVAYDPTDDGTEDWEGVSYLVSGVIGQINNPYYCFGKFEPVEGVYDPGKYGLSHGRNCYPVGEYSISSGNSCGAMNAYSFARGRDAWARGIFAIACGDSCAADADYGMAIGYQCHAYATNSIAIGYGRVATKVGSISIGDYHGSTEFFIVDGVANWDSTNSVWNFTLSGIPFYTAQALNDGYYLGDFYNPNKLVQIQNIISRTETSSGVYTIVVKSYSDDTSLYHDGDTVRFYINPSGSYSQGSVSVGNSLSKAEFGTALGERTVMSRRGGLAIGSYNSVGEDAVFVIGGGYSEYNRSDLFRVDGRGNVWAAGNVRTEDDNIDGSLLTVNSPFQLLFCRARKMGGFIFFSLEIFINATFIPAYLYTFGTINSNYLPINFSEIGTGHTTDSSYNPKGTATWFANHNGDMQFRLESGDGPYVFLSGFYAYE